MIVRKIRIESMDRKEKNYFCRKRGKEEKLIHGDDRVGKSGEEIERFMDHGSNHPGQQRFYLRSSRALSGHSC